MTFQDDFGSGAYTLKDGQISPNKLWKCVYAGYGSVGVQNIQSPTNGRTGSCMFLQPQINNTSTSASLVITQGSQFTNFDETFYMRTIRQNKYQPNNWETAWHMFRYTDNTHHYYFYIGANGTIEVGKKDYVKVGTDKIQTPDGKVTVVGNGNQDQQVFLSTASKVTFTLGKWYKIRLVMEGFNIKIYIDDVLKVDVTDDGKTGSWLGSKVAFKPSAQMSKGNNGWYVEDAKVEFDNVEIKDSVPTTPTPTPTPPTPTPTPEPVPTEKVYCAMIGDAMQRVYKTESGCDAFVAKNGTVYAKRVYPFYP